MKMKPQTFLLAAATLAIAACLLPARAEVVYSDTFSDGNRDGWYSANSSATLTASTGKMSLKTTDGTTNASNYALTYVTSAGSYLTIQEGQTLTLTVQFSSSNLTTDTAFYKLGLYNSGGSRISADASGTSNTTYTSYTGYMAQYDLDTNTSKALNESERTSTSTNLMTSGTPYTSLGTSDPSRMTAAKNTLYTETISLTLNSGVLTITSTITDGTTTLTSTGTDTSPVTSFDTIAFALQGSSSYAPTLDISSVSIAIVPEPSTVACLALGFAVLGWTARLRRSRLE